MKKAIFAFLVASAVLSGRAEWLAWCVSDFDKYDDGTVLDVEDQIKYMRVGYVSNNGKDQPQWSGHTLLTYDSDGDLMSDANGNVEYVSQGDDRYAVNVTGMTDANYGFYIELLNANKEVIGRTGSEKTFKYDTYATLNGKGFVTTGDLADIPSIEVWHGSFEAVPEPSSMALLALGAGLVGLRRKLRKNKKDKKEKRA